MTECDHIWAYEKEWYRFLELDTCLRIPVFCDKCKKLAHQTWTENMITDRDTGKELD